MRETQPERTTLSWTRTALATMVVSMVLLRWSEAYPALVTPAILVIVAFGAGLMVSNGTRYSVQPRAGAVALTTLMMLLFGAVGLVLVLISD
ncbi:DUF202 domain-containing protein [Corynebacterium timonense]|uniref:DUF202 domain-containing protein n=1 Tax=Corynebacterium timonense TaxID=441500 RepID=A0A1H1UPT1_9CORY|nr:DUF202 domain-containing protein [Corynebacterium timonense]SDS74505.1 protein of unknown function [Corynebacterium timonense]